MIYVIYVVNNSVDRLLEFINFQIIISVPGSCELKVIMKDIIG